MAEARDPASIIEAAQQAAGAGDFVAAERFLREAVAIQEADLGSSHPDLATTLNNLAFVCERLNKLDEAERGYRRAHAIAVASLSPGHPFIKTSLSNLVEFCAARGVPLWTPPEAPVEDEPLGDEDDLVPAPSIDVAPPIAREPAVTNRLPFHMIGVAALVIAAIVVIVFARQGQGTTDPPSPISSQAPVQVPSLAPGQAPTQAPSLTPPPSLPPSGGPVTVLKAQLCSGLEKSGSPDWQCKTAADDLQPGTYMFYTRLLTTADTSVEHRWYRGNRVHQVMRLRVTASPGNGYRTFSATTVSPERAGEWKVELRAADGTLLDEAHFVVR